MARPMTPWTTAGLLAATVASAVANGAEPVLTFRQLSLEMANQLAMGAVKACREQGYQVSAVVVDRSGNPQTLMRDALASRFTIQIAQEKANAVILSGINSADFRANRHDIRPEMNHVDGILMLEGGIPVRSGGFLLGALGVSGAPGGEKDAACALQAVEAVVEQLEFAD